MEEARRFLRYVLPGLVSLFVFSALAIISDADFLAKLKNTVGEEISGVLILLLTTGAAGYISSIVHHVCYNNLPVYEKFGFVVDLRNSVGKAIDDSRIKLVDRDGQSRPSGSLAMKDAWCITNIIVHSNMKKGIFKAAHGRLQSLWDLVHAAGATLIGTAFAVIAWMIYAISAQHSFSRSLFAIILAIVLLFLMALNLKSISRTASDITQGILSIYFEKSDDTFRINCHRDGMLRFF